MQTSLNRISIVRLAARILSGALFLLWGSFFVEHLSWFGSVPSENPPLLVWLLSSLHFTLLVGYAVTLKWEKLGSAIMSVSAILFFSFAAGMNAIPFIIVSIFPAMLYAYCWMKERNNHELKIVH
ncbi:MAG: hypothetical protein HYV29_06610 [Ignavibacteriales bacterium]|nr:hypothetical protein [Ignavibacteriales bacterium]